MGFGSSPGSPATLLRGRETTRPVCLAQFTPAIPASVLGVCPFTPKLAHLDHKLYIHPTL